MRALVKVRLRVRVGVLVRVTTGRVCGRVLRSACERVRERVCLLRVRERARDSVCESDWESA